MTHVFHRSDGDVAAGSVARSASWGRARGGLAPAGLWEEVQVTVQASVLQREDAPVAGPALGRSVVQIRVRAPELRRGYAAQSNPSCWLRSCGGAWSLQELASRLRGPRRCGATPLEADAGPPNGVGQAPTSGRPWLPITRVPTHTCIVALESFAHLQYQGPMQPHVRNRILQLTRADHIARTELIQPLWNNYGTLSRVMLQGGPHRSVIVKHIQIPKEPGHPRGFASGISRDRKVRSYEVETHWYQHQNQEAPQGAPTPRCLDAFAEDGELFLLLEVWYAGSLLF